MGVCNPYFSEKLWLKAALGIVFCVGPSLSICTYCTSVCILNHCVRDDQNQNRNSVSFKLDTEYSYSSICLLCLCVSLCLRKFWVDLHLSSFLSSTITMLDTVASKQGKMHYIAFMSDNKVEYDCSMHWNRHIGLKLSKPNSTIAK